MSSNQTDFSSMANSTSFETVSVLLNKYSTYCRNKKTSIVELLGKTHNLMDARQRNVRSNVVRLINNIRPHIARIEADARYKALHFNVFNALGVSRKEVMQSRFLAYLLSPNEHHYQKAKFLNSFLSVIGIHPVSEKQFRQVSVITERSVDDGRMDIVIECKPEWLVVIENKVDAGEGNKQLARYRKWLSSQIGYKEKQLIFLTPDGHEPITGDVDKQLSYQDIVNILGDPENIPQELVKSVVKQYITICQQIGGVDMTAQDKELQDLLISQENVRAALEIEQQMKFVRIGIAKNFGQNISIILQHKIDENVEIQKKWRSFSETDLSGITKVAVRTALHNNKPNYQLFVQNAFTDNINASYGWCRPQWVDIKQAQETDNLTKKMIQDGCNGKEPWWVASKPLPRRYALNEIDDIIDCMNDNQSTEHQLANEIASVVWEMFVAYRTDIEELESFKQANS